MTREPVKRLSPLAWVVVLFAAGLTGLVAYYFAFAGKQSEHLREWLMQNQCQASDQKTTILGILLLVQCTTEQ